MFKNISRTRQIVIGLSLSVAVFILLILFSFKVYRTLNNSFDKVEHTYTIINEVESLLHHLTQASLNEVEYSVSNNEGYLHNFIVSYQMVQKKLHRLDSLTKDDKSQQERLQALNQLVIHREKILLDHINKVSRTEELPAEVLIRSAGKFQHEATALLEEIKRVEHKALLLRKQEAGVQHQATFYVDIFAGLGAFILVVITLTILVKDHRAREQAEEELRKLNENKDKFFSIVSHDLRGPAANIVKLSEFLLGPDEMLDNQMRREMAQHLNFSSQKLYKLLENLLSWAKLQMNRVDIKPFQVNLHKLVSENIAQISTLASDKKIQVINEVAADFSAYADDKMCETVIRNLIVNAIKFTNPGGHIKIRASHKDRFVEISVIDSGVGMKKESVEKLFNLGTHFSSKGTANEPGSGLGLILCKEFVEKNKGRIWAESEINNGSTFTFSLPRNILAFEAMK
jgi:two-component system, sensor histidine kinase and response regulator